MENERKKDRIMLAIILITLVLTILFMNGQKLGLKSITSDKAADQASSYSARDLNDSYDESSAVYIDLSDIGNLALAAAYELDGDLYLVSKGTFVLSGTMASNHSIIIDAKGAKLQIVLDGVTIENEDVSPIVVKNADKVFITLTEGSENTLAVSGALDEDFAEHDKWKVSAVIYSRADLCINGSGTLTVNAPDSSLNGIRTSDDLILTGGHLIVQAGKNGIVGHDSVRILDGEIEVTSGQDGIKANNDEDPEKGNVVIDGGTITVDVGDDGIHAESLLTINAGTICIWNSYEGLEGYDITINDGDISIRSSDDGINAGSGYGSDFGGPGMGFGGHGMGFDDPDFRGEKPGDFSEGEDFRPQERNTELTDASDSAAERTELPNLIINGGIIHVDADGDGLDSNGNLQINGGLIYVNGPTNSGNGALDSGSESGGKLTIHGGTILALGASGMAEAFGEGSEQVSLIFTTSDSFVAGDFLEIRDVDGASVIGYEISKSGNSAVFSSADLIENEEYTLWINGENRASATAVYENASGGFGGFGGGGGFGGFGGFGGHGDWGKH